MLLKGGTLSGEYYDVRKDGEMRIGGGDDDDDVMMVWALSTREGSSPATWPCQKKGTGVRVPPSVNTILGVVRLA
jgi:hypothetical protein